MSARAKPISRRKLFEGDPSSSAQLLSENRSNCLKETDTSEMADDLSSERSDVITSSTNQITDEYRNTSAVLAN
jgi:hypothetical protein